MNTGSHAVELFIRPCPTPGRLADAARERVSGRSQVLQTRWGGLEYAVAGDASGPALLMIHGTGGGFDQGLRFADALVARGMRVIAPSRFGYLRSDFPVDPSLAEQADALAALLDHLGIARIVVAGGSADTHGFCAAGNASADRVDRRRPLRHRAHGARHRRPGAAGAAGYPPRRRPSLAWARRGRGGRGAALRPQRPLGATWPGKKWASLDFPKPESGCRPLPICYAFNSFLRTFGEG